MSSPFKKEKHSASCSGEGTRFGWILKENIKNTKKKLTCNSAIHVGLARNV